MRKILFIGAHADDVEISAGGTVVKLAKEGNEVYHLVLSDGSKGVHLLNISAKKMALLREKEASEAGKVLGIKNVIFLRFKDGEIENTLKLRKQIVRVIRKVKPEIVFCFDPANLTFENPHRFHRDHRMAAEAIFDSVFPASGNISFFPELIKEGYIPHSAKEIWFFGSNKPNQFINIDKTINTKLEGVFRYASQVERKFIEQKVKLMGRKFNKRSKSQYCEAFRSIKLS